MSRPEAPHNLLIYFIPDMILPQLSALNPPHRLLTIRTTSFNNSLHCCANLTLSIKTVPLLIECLYKTLRITSPVKRIPCNDGKIVILDLVGRVLGQLNEDTGKFLRTIIALVCSAWIAHSVGVERLSIFKMPGASLWQKHIARAKKARVKLWHL